MVRMPENGVGMNYSVLHPCDTFFTYASDPIGACIRIGEAGLKAAWDGHTVNHVGMLAENRGQIYAVEIQARGIEKTSLEKYRKPGNRIMEVWRNREVALDPEQCAEMEDYLELWWRRTQDKGYDFWGAFRSSSWVRRLCPWLRDDPNREFCSESVYEAQKTIWNVSFPLEWNNKNPNPLQLRNWYAAHRATWEKIEGWLV